MDMSKLHLYHGIVRSQKIAGTDQRACQLRTALIEPLKSVNGRKYSRSLPTRQRCNMTYDLYGVMWALNLLEINAESKTFLSG